MLFDDAGDDSAVVGGAFQNFVKLFPFDKFYSVGLVMKSSPMARKINIAISFSRQFRRYADLKTVRFVGIVIAECSSIDRLE